MYRHHHWSRPYIDTHRRSSSWGHNVMSNGHIQQVVRTKQQEEVWP